jgi:hypothetical protein
VGCCCSNNKPNNGGSYWSSGSDGGKLVLEMYSCESMANATKAEKLEEISHHRSTEEISKKKIPGTLKLWENSQQQKLRTD